MFDPDLKAQQYKSFLELDLESQRRITFYTIVFWLFFSIFAFSPLFEIILSLTSVASKILLSITWVLIFFGIGYALFIIRGKNGYVYGVIVLITSFVISVITLINANNGMTLSDFLCL